MTPGFTLHTGNSQPIETRGKKVIYKLFESERFGVNQADELNWQVSGFKAPTNSGRIFEYKIVR